MLIPPKHGNAHLVLSNKAIFHYKQSTYYEGQGKQFTYLWNDPSLKIKWPIKIMTKNGQNNIKEKPRKLWRNFGPKENGQLKNRLKILVALLLITLQRSNVLSDLSYDDSRNDGKFHKNR